MSASYAATLAALAARGRFGIRLGLGRTRGLLRAMGSPELGLRGALIGGTNGKGSVQALVAACLSEAGWRVGQTPKPHLVSYRERILVAGRPIAAPDFAALVGEVLRAADHVERRLGPPTEFEVLTVAALTWFARQAVEVAVVEVGLGGRLDATNAWDGGVAAITNVQLDHMDRLGPTLRAIGREKAAIVKRGDRAVTGADGPGLDVIRRRARRLRVPLREVEPLEVAGMDRSGLHLREPEIGALDLALLGRHQAANAAVALGVLRELEAAGIARLPPGAIGRGFAAARWPGRLELLERPDGPAGGVQVILDGAHNVAGAAALGEALDELRPSLAPGRATLLCAVMADKQVEEIVAALAASKTLRGARIITTAVALSRALGASLLADAWRRSLGGPARRVSSIGSVEEALASAIDAARLEGGPLIVAGSLYLIGEVRNRLVADPELRDPA